MDYLLNRYLFGILPFEVAEETKKAWGQKAVSLVMVRFSPILKDCVNIFS